MRTFIKPGVWMFAIVLLAILGLPARGDLRTAPYTLDTGLVSRSISFENPTGTPGEGGKAASKLGPTRKGAPNRAFKPGETVQLADIKGPGTIRHIWMTISDRKPETFRSFVIRAYWDGQEHPSIECPLGDFFGFAHGKVESYQSAVHSLGQNAGMNIWLPMPFTNRAYITLTNETDHDVTIYYQIDYTIDDDHPEDVGRLHVLFRRENPTTLKQDFELLPKREAKGRFIGSLVGVRALHNNWWGEGEIKVYMDGDEEFPTICGTGTEDWVCLSYGLQQTPFMYHGANLSQGRFHSFYRWHLPDPIYWEKEVRITIQQIAWDKGLAEVQDDWSAATFWYEPVPSASLPEMPDLAARTAELWKK
ncbi:MAG: glycoside hydrolase family 172 protein [Candidatus Hydrogenedentes bacterium]|nr:glycoside hydrolase family 172 protein [Candidatus Hydrogenedentota bacterium]